MKVLTKEEADGKHFFIPFAWASGYNIVVQRLFPSLADCDASPGGFLLLVPACHTRREAEGRIFRNCEEKYFAFMAVFHWCYVD